MENNSIKTIISKNFKLHSCLDPSIRSLKNVPSFFKEISTNWAKCLLRSPSLPSAIISQFLWFNSNVKIDNKSNFISYFANKRTNFVGQIFHENCKNKSRDCIKSEYNLESKLKHRWIQLTDALPKLWKDTFLNCIGNAMNLFIFDHHLIKKNLYCLKKLGSRGLYQIQTSEKYEKPTLQLYYERYFNKFYFSWKSIYLLPCILPVDTKLRVFQYKIPNNILFVNKMLFKFRKVNHHCVLSAKLKMKLTYIYFIGSEKLSFYRDNFRSFLVPLSIFLVYRHRVPSSVS